MHPLNFLATAMKSGHSRNLIIIIIIIDHYHLFASNTYNTQRAKWTN